MKKNTRKRTLDENYHAPLFREGKNVLYRNGKHSSRFDGRFMPSGAYFGQLADGRRFIAVIEGSKIGMASHVGLNMWENTFCQSVVELLKDAGVKFTSSVSVPEIRQSTPKRAIHTAKDLLLQELYSAKTTFYPFVDYILFVADAENPLGEVAKRPFGKFRVSSDVMEQIKNVTEQLFQLEQESMDSRFLQKELDESRRKRIDEWYGFLGYKEYQNRSGTVKAPIFRASRSELHLMDMVYLKATHVTIRPDLHPESVFFCYLVLEIARQLKNEPLVGEDMLLYQKAIKIQEGKKKPKQISEKPEADKSKEHDPMPKLEKGSEEPMEFKAEKHTLYVCQGRIKCLREHHPTDCVTAKIPTAGDTTAFLNVNRCRKCCRFYISYDEYEHYLAKYKSLLTRIVLVNGNGTELFSGNFAEASPLKLCGYSVSRSKGFTRQERERILSEVIHNGIMSKADVIQYLNWFIKMNGRKIENVSAKEKWKSDLAFVRSLDMNRQDTVAISKIAPYQLKKKSKK